MSQCKVYLENYTGTYYPGNEIRGRLECYFNDETKVRGIKIRLKCNEHNEWSGTEEYTDPTDNKLKTRTVTLTGKRDVLYVEQMLFGSGSGTHHVNRGRQVYPFSYILPDNIPSTFTGPHGSITYALIGIVDIPMGFDYEDSFIFIVVAPIDFNKLPKDLQEPSHYSDEKTVCCWCCKGGNISVDVELPKKTYMAGEIMNLKVSVSNLSNSNVEDLKVKFKKTTTYKVTSPTSESKNDVEEIANIKEHGVGAHGEHTYNLQLPIPQHIVVPNFAQCHLFHVTYVLEISCEMPACTLDLDISVWDIQLGHIPWRDNYGIEGGSITPSFINSLPPIDGAYPPGVPATGYPPAYPPPGPTPYPPPVSSPYPPGPTSYPPPVSTYPPGPTSYPPPGPSPYPPSNNMGFVPPSDNPTSPLLPGKPVYPGGPPTAPTQFGASAPPKAQEAAMGGGPSAPPGPNSNLPPPSYNELQQTSGNFYPPS